MELQDSRSITQLIHSLAAHDCHDGVTRISKERTQNRVRRRKARTHEILLGEDAIAKQVQKLLRHFHFCVALLHSRAPFRQSNAQGQCLMGRVYFDSVLSSAGHR